MASDALELTFLGTGAAMPTGDRFQTGMVIGDDERRLLVDCGSGVLHRLQQAGIGYESIETILLTHHHLDHVADLMPLMKARWLAGETTQTIAGPPGTQALVDRLFDAHDYMRDRLDLAVRTVEPGTFTLEGFTIEAIETIHSVTCHAYRLDDTVTFSGDTEPCARVAELADGSVVLVHECAFPDEVDVSNHTRPSELGELLDGTDIGRVYLNHLYPHCSGREEELVERVTANFDGRVRVARDLQTVRVTRTDQSMG